MSGDLSDVCWANSNMASTKESSGPAQAFHPQDPALRQEDSSSRHVGRAAIECRAKSAEKKVRHPVFKDLREKR
jgi:hypothetical protein